MRQLALSTDAKRDMTLRRYVMKQRTSSDDLKRKPMVSGAVTSELTLKR